MKRDNILYITNNKYGCVVTYVTKDKRIESVRTKIRLKEYLNELSEKNHVSFDGTIKLLTKKYNFVQKVPILIKHEQCLFLLTTSIESDDCVAVNYYCIRKIMGKGDGSTEFYFCVPHEIFSYPIEHKKKFPFNQRLVKKQMDRCELIDRNMDVDLKV